MALDINALLDLWTQPLGADDDAAEAFRSLYTDPVIINGTPLTADELVQRARTLQQALETIQRELLDICQTDSKVAIAFQLGGRHIGPLTTSAGVLAPTGEQFSMRVIDILTLTNGRISSVVMVGHELGALSSINAATLVQPRHPFRPQRHTQSQGPPLDIMLPLRDVPPTHKESKQAMKQLVSAFEPEFGPTTRPECGPVTGSEAGSRAQRADSVGKVCRRR
jgi:hypothetical protein